MLKKLIKKIKYIKCRIFGHSCQKLIGIEIDRGGLKKKIFLCLGCGDSWEEK